MKSYLQHDVHVEFVRLNGETGIVYRRGDAALSTALMKARDGKLSEIYIIRNPDKLNRI